MSNEFRDFLISKEIYFEEDTDGNVWVADLSLLPYKDEVDELFPLFEWSMDLPEAPEAPEQQHDE